MQKPLLVVPLDGGSPFLIHDPDLFVYNEIVKHYAMSDSHWVIDPSDNTYLAKEEGKEVLSWYYIEVEEQTLGTSNPRENMVARTE